MKFLIDECLSPELAVLARARGFPESTHVTWLGMRSRTDWAIVHRAISVETALLPSPFPLPRVRGERVEKGWRGFAAPYPELGEGVIWSDRKKAPGG